MLEEGIDSKDGKNGEYGDGDSPQGGRFALSRSPDCVSQGILPLSISISLSLLQSLFCQWRMGELRMAVELLVDNSILRPLLWQAALLSAPPTREE